MIDAALISTVGFPIAITSYLLLRFEKKIAENTMVVKELVIYLKNGR
jgi:hypothetical protein